MSELILLNIDEVDEKQIVTHVQDVSAVLNHNEILRQNSDEIWNSCKGSKQVASLDMATYLELQKHGITQDPKLFMRWLERNPEYKTTTKQLI